MIERPYDIDAEISVLGGIILENADYAMVAELVTADDFYLPEHRAVFEAMQGLYAENAPIDLITVKAQLEKNGAFPTLVDSNTLVQIAGFTCTSANTRHYCRIVSEKAQRRRLIDLCAKTAKDAANGENPLADALSYLQNGLFDIAKAHYSDNETHIGEVLVKTIDTIEENCKNGGKLIGIPTGFRGFDGLTGGLLTKQLVIIAARPAMGKSCLAGNIAVNAAKAGYPTAFFSLEMSDEEIVTRMLSNETNIFLRKMKNGELGGNDWIDVANGISGLAGLPLWIYDRAGVTPSWLFNTCKLLKAEHGLKLAVVDYLQLMSPDTKRHDSKQQEVAEISRELKRIAKELDITLIVLSQLSRATETRNEHRPTLSDLRDSGAIEQDADIVTFVFREEVYSPENKSLKGVCEWIIAKHRNGETGTIRLGFQGGTQRFYSFEN